MKELLDKAASLFTNDQEPTNKEVETSDTTAQEILDQIDYSTDHRRGRRPNGSKSLTPGRRKTLRESGWDGVQGTHRQVKYRKLQKLQQRLKDAEEKVRAHSGDRKEAFGDHAEHLRQRIDRQERKIAEAEA